MTVFKSGFVTIIGRPNVGKSTLLNAVLGQKIAIMSDKPQTTRNKIQGFYTTEEAQIVFIDTPGIHKPQHKLGEYMVTVAERTLNEVDVILYLVDATSKFGAGEEFIIKQLGKVETPVFLVINKIDLISRDQLLALIAEYSNKFPFAEIMPLSALKEDGVDHMLEILVQYLSEGPQFYPEDMVTDQPEKAIVAELIREKVLFLTREEIPHSVAVEVTDFKEREGNTIYIGAVIYVERDSQKGIIIGKKGSMLKEIGKLARVDIENLLDSKVYLELWVKVKKDWRNQDVALRNFGFDKKNI
ncbi:GTPase Era [Dehalobacterium formicoaceticum]|uniref:GTPase Era n=1 Tax=Dehalobacterium formicoaceticum TaxID=51515 RepID=A0ABT1XZJ4_9FIRM|nr:GTPase Era [Dehalobacterium formicoaceticum]MCR6544033.1 GTPase Era [Dehalobacterium formicoaceticum]